MSLFLGNRARLIHKVQGGPEIGKLVTLQKMMLIDHLPAGDLRLQGFQCFALQRIHSAAARYAMLLCQTHCLTPRRVRGLRQRRHAPRKTTWYSRTERSPKAVQPAVGGRSNQGISSTAPHSSQMK